MFVYFCFCLFIFLKRAQFESYVVAIVVPRWRRAFIIDHGGMFSGCQKLSKLQKSFLYFLTSNLSPVEIRGTLV
jgi:hypothetical protein